MLGVSDEFLKRWDIDDDWNIVQYNCINPTSSDVYFNLFDPNILYNVPDAPPSFFIRGSSNYNQDLRDYRNSPAWIRRVEVYSHNQENLNQVINHTYKDANGNEMNIPRIPSLSIGVNQYQGWRAELDFKGNADMVLGINQWFTNLFIKAHSQIGFIFIYNQLQLTKLLSKKSFVDRSITFVPNDVQSVSEKTLDETALVNPTTLIRVGEDGKPIVPFNFDWIR